MRVFRLAKTQYINDLSGMGPRLYGGRWNQKGTGLLYTSESRSLAALEFLVHLPMSIAPRDLSIIFFDIPETITLQEIPESSLPKNWREYPPPEVLATMGTKWVHSGESLLLRVPSAVIRQEFNILINPGHQDFGLLKASPPAAFTFDERLFSSRN